MLASMALSPLARGWSTVPVRSRAEEVSAGTVRRWLADLPPPPGYAVAVRPLRYRRAPHLAAFCWYDDRLIELQIPLPFVAWDERVYYRARRRPGTRLRFQWFSTNIRMRTRREVVRFLYCHEFYHWYLKEVRGGKAAAETACDRFALAHFRSRNRGVDWSALLPGYLPTRRPLKRAA
jgi:hypothetical protein